MDKTPIFTTIAQACNAADAAEKAGERYAEYDTAEARMMFVQYENAAYEARAAAVALSRTITLGVEYAPPCARKRIAVAVTRLVDAVDLATKAAKDAAVDPVEAAAYTNDITAAYIVDTFARWRRLLSVLESTSGLQDVYTAENGAYNDTKLLLFRVFDFNYGGLVYTTSARRLVSALRESLTLISIDEGRAHLPAYIAD